MSFISFVHGAMLWGCLAVAAPVIIHLIMRSRPRRQTLPTMRFVRKTHRASVSMLRLKHLLLLAMRVAAIVLLAMLLGLPMLAGFFNKNKSEKGSSIAAGPTAVVVVVDNSASMGYSRQGRNALQRGNSVAAEIIESLPAGSRVAVVRTDDSTAGGGFLADRKLAAQHVVGVSAGCGASPVAPAMRRAFEMLKQADLDEKHILVISDLTRRSWRDWRFDRSAPGVRFTVIDCGADRPANVAVGAASLSSASCPAGGQVFLEATLDGVNLGGQMNLQVELDGRAVERRVVMLPVGGAASVRIVLQPRRAGLCAGRLVLRNADALEADNVRYFALRVAPPAEVLMVSSPRSADDRTGFLMANAIAPPLRSSAGRLARRNIAPASLDAKSLADRPLVVLAGVSALRAGQWKMLEDYLRAGGRVWVVAGSMVSADSYNTAAAQRLMPLKLKGQQELPAPLGWRAPAATRAMFTPFTDPAETNPPISAVRCGRRFAVLSLASDAEVQLAYTDGCPAIVTRRVGAGRVVFWNFSPARSWSNLARLGGQFVVLAQRTAELLLRGEDEQGDFPWGTIVQMPIPPGLRSPAIALRRADDEASMPYEGDLRRRVVKIPADRLGVYAVTFSEGQRSLQRGFSVNVSYDESDLDRIAAEKLKQKFPPGSLAVISAAAGMPARSGGTPLSLDLLPPVLIVLLILLTCESFFANRFYKKGSPPK